MRLFDIVASGCVAFFCIGIVITIFFKAFEDTETFMAIDEKIAKIIRGKEHETD